MSHLHCSFQLSTFILFITIGAANIVTGQKRNLLAIAKTWYHQLSLTALKLMQSNKTIGGFHLGFLTSDDLIVSTMLKLVELYAQGKIKPCIDSCHHFEEVCSIVFYINLNNKQTEHQCSVNFVDEGCGEM